MPERTVVTGSASSWTLRFRGVSRSGRDTTTREPLSFGHTLEDQIGGQTDAGFLIAGFYSDRDDAENGVSRYLPCYHATRAVKP